MKKILLSTFALFVFGFAQAQEDAETTASQSPSYESSKGEEYLPKAGDYAIGFNANGIFRYLGNAFNGTVNNAAPDLTNLKGGAFVGKKFITDNQAYRLVVNVGLISDKTTTTSNNNPIPPAPAPLALITRDSIVSVSAFDIQLGFGKEWRRGKSRLQGFYGADALVGFNNGAKTTTEVNQVVTPAAPQPIVKRNSKQTIDNGSIFNFGLNGFVGAEYFIFPKMSLGAQYNWGVNLAFQGSGKTTINSSTNGVAVPEVEIENAGKNTKINLGGVGVTSINLTVHF
jgi:hypothetical protein